MVAGGPACLQVEGGDRKERNDSRWRRVIAGGRELSQVEGRAHRWTKVFADGGELWRVVGGESKRSGLAAGGGEPSKAEGSHDRLTRRLCWSRPGTRAASRHGQALPLSPGRGRGHAYFSPSRPGRGFTRVGLGARASLDSPRPWIDGPHSDSAGRCHGLPRARIAQRDML